MPTDKSLWETYTRSLRPLQGKTEGKKKTSPPKAEDRKQKAERKPSPFKGEGWVGVMQTKNYPCLNQKANHVSALERKREKSLRQGTIDIDAKLDLHGLTQTEAFEALAGFMRKKTKAGKRNLLIVTGRGREGQGVLRQNLQNWLAGLPESKSILAVREAAPNHGGKGAFYVLMKKTRLSNN